MEIPKGVVKAESFEGKYGTKMEFPYGVGGSSYKTFRGRGMNISWNNTLTKEWLCLHNRGTYFYIIVRH